MSARRFTIIGPGRAGLSLRGALIDVGWECVQTFGRGDDVAGASLGVDVCIIATPDAAIADIAGRIQPGNAVVVHLSGATPLSVLGTANEVAALHPLQSLPNPEAGRDALRQAHFAVAGNEVSKEIAEALSGNWFEIEDSDRALYHCAAAIASNHSVALLGQVERLAASIGVPFEAFESLVSTSVTNAFAHGPAAALTGPAARGDEGTLDAHRNALEVHDASELSSYDAMVEQAQRLVTERDDDKT